MSESAASDPGARRPTALVVLTAMAVVASFYFALGRAPLFDVDEGAFSQATLEMFQRGDFLSTYLNGVPRHDKPILIYWLQAASVLALGTNEFAFRLPSALCATLWVVLIFLFARRRFGIDTALLAAGMTATSLGVYAIGRAATADALLNLLIAGSMFAVWMHFETGERRWLYTAHATIGLGFLAKGPVAILVPVAVSFLFCMLRRNLKIWARSVFDPIGLSLFALIALPWYIIVMLGQEGWGFFQGFFLKHNLGRFRGTLQGQAGNLGYYVPVVLIGTLPFTACLVRVALRVKTAWRDDLQCYLLLWFGFVFVFFSLSGTKLPHYVLYGMTGMFILMAAYGPETRRVWIMLPGLLVFLFLLALPALVEGVLLRLGQAYDREALGAAAAHFGAGYFAFVAAATAMILWSILDARHQVAGALVVTGALAVITLSAFVVPAAAGFLQQPVKEAALLAREQGWDVIMWRLNVPSFSVYYGRPTPSREPKPGDVVITRAKRVAELPKGDHQVMYAKNGVVLVRVGR